MSDSPIGVGIIGFGTVGQGAYKILLENADVISRQVGRQVFPVAVADRSSEGKEHLLDPRTSFYTDAKQLIASDDVQIVCELIGGVTPAGDFVRAALEAGKSVVTANKELIAKQGPELLKLAQDKNVDLYFEGSVGGGIPIIAPLRSQLAGNDVQRVLGIVNGTTNFILTQMAAGAGAFDEVLKEAQSLGYAEADPTNDIEGFDARYKLNILASLGFQAKLNVDQILCEGITGLNSRDVDYANELGYKVKLLAVAKRIDGKIEARVHPTLIPLSHPLASVNGVNNAIFVTGNAVGDVMFFGPGAGGGAAGSAVIGDVVEIARNMIAGATGRLKCPEFQDLPVLPPDDITARYYLRLIVKDCPGVLASIATEFGQHKVSIAALVQKDAREGEAEIIFLTHEVRERGLKDALENISKLDTVKEVCSLLRVEE